MQKGHGQVAHQLLAIIDAQATAFLKFTQANRFHVLPGGDFEVSGFDDLLGDVRSKYPFLDTSQSERLVRSYGLKALEILGDAETADDLGEDFDHGLTEAEVRYLITSEWAMVADDVLWRRSKLGIRMSRKQTARLEAFMNDYKQQHNLAAE